MKYAWNRIKKISFPKSIFTFKVMMTTFWISMEIIILFRIALVITLTFVRSKFKLNIVYRMAISHEWTMIKCYWTVLRFRSSQINENQQKIWNQRKIIKRKTIGKTFDKSIYSVIESVNIFLFIMRHSS